MISTVKADVETSKRVSRQSLFAGLILMVAGCAFSSTQTPQASALEQRIIAREIAGIQKLAASSTVESETNGPVPAPSP